MGDGVIAVDVEGRVDLLNPPAVAFTGWTGEAARGHLVEEVVNLVDSVTGAPLPNPARTALTTGGPERTQGPHHPGDGPFRCP